MRGEYYSFLNPFGERVCGTLDRHGASNTQKSRVNVQVRISNHPKEHYTYHPNREDSPISSDRCLETYLREIDEVPLLTPDQEVALGRRVQEGESCWPLVSDSTDIPSKANRLLSPSGTSALIR